MTVRLITNDFLDGKRIAYSSETTFIIQAGWGKRSYVTRNTVKGDLGQAVTLYDAITVHSGYKKRLIMEDKVIARELTNP